MLVAVAIALAGHRPGVRRTRSRSAPCPRARWSKSWAWRRLRALSPVPRTAQLLRVSNLTDDLADDVRPLLEKLQAVADREPSADKVYALSELAFLGGKQVGAERQAGRAGPLRRGRAARLRLSLRRPARPSREIRYDPQYRGACDLYNGALEVGAADRLRGRRSSCPGTTKTIHTASGTCDITCVLRGGRWRPEDFDHFEFVSDYEVKGLKNLYQTHGLGVPLIAVRRSYQGEPVGAKFYPPGLSFPVTAFLRPLLPDRPADRPARPALRCVLELCDPLTDQRDGDGRAVRAVGERPDDAAGLFSLAAGDGNLATVGLLEPDELLKLRPGGPRTIMGLYMVQPYEPGKIPVLMVHGLWSSPMTWMEMFNDLRSSPTIRDRYQFWFYLYPTGQPFWLSAAQLRRDLAQARRTLDPQHQEPALDQMVLVGHSMGGLVARLQTYQSGDDYWRLVSNEPLSAIKADPKEIQQLREMFFFQPNPSIRRVVTIATPFRGSTFSNQTTQWLLDKLIHPERLLDGLNSLYLDNPGAFAPATLCCGSTRASIRWPPPNRSFPSCWPRARRRGSPITTSSASCRSSGGSRSWPATATAWSRAKAPTPPTPSRRSPFRPITRRSTLIRRPCWKSAASCWSTSPSSTARRAWSACRPSERLSGNLVSLRPIPAGPGALFDPSGGSLLPAPAVALLLQNEKPQMKIVVVRGLRGNSEPSAGCIAIVSDASHANRGIKGD